MRVFILIQPFHDVIHKTGGLYREGPSFFAYLRKMKDSQMLSGLETIRGKWCWQNEIGWLVSHFDKCEERISVKWWYREY